MVSGPKKLLSVRLPFQFAEDQRPQGLLKSTPEDFIVEEVPAFSLSGHGDFVYVEVVKRNLTGHQLLSLVARHYGIPISHIGAAGTKDRLALTTQRLSLPRSCLSESAPKAPELIDWKVLGLHDQPLRPGRLLGNRFLVRLKIAQGKAEQWFPQAYLRQRPVGWANYYGIQRFGEDNHNWEKGLQLLKTPPPKGQRIRWPGNFPISVVQSQLFNEVLEQRVAMGGFCSLQEGDIVDSGQGPRPVQPGGDDQRAFQEFRLQLLGPIWGYKLLVSNPMERELLARHGLDSQMFRPFRAPGTRRVMRLPLPEVDYTSEYNHFVLKFCLPPGSYATVFLQHFFQLELSPTGTGFTSGLEVPDDR